MTVDAYVICTAPRSGSTLLCSLLAATGIAGRPDSYFHGTSLDAWLADYGMTRDPGLSELALVESVVAAALAEGRGGTGLFGLRLQQHSFAFFRRHLALLHPQAVGDVQAIEAAFGRTLFIHLGRADKIGQAVSRVKAEQTGLWHVAADGSELERLGPARTPRYDGEAIRAAIDEATRQDRAWEAWFAREGVMPLRLDYAELAADPGAVLGRVLTHLGLDPAAAQGVAPGVRKLADTVSRGWVARFRAESDGQG